MTDDSLLDSAAVEIDQFYPHTPDRVWRALTDPPCLAKWLMPTTGFEAPAVGAQFVFTVPGQAPGEIACKVLAMSPGRQLVLRWVDLRAQLPARWTLDWTVRGEGRGTRLMLTHTGFDVSERRQKMARNGMERMWRRALTKLGAVLDDASPWTESDGGG